MLSITGSLAGIIGFETFVIILTEVSGNTILLIFHNKLMFLANKH